MNTSPILIVDDDRDDLEMIMEVMKTLDLPYPVIPFTCGIELKKYLTEHEQPPFLTICDMNLPKQGGLDVIDSIFTDPSTRYKSVPFVF